MKPIYFLLIVFATALTLSAHAEVGLYDQNNGQFLGNLNNNPYDPNSIANPYGQYGNPYGNTVTNPYSQYGNPYAPGSVNNPYGGGGGVLNVPQNPFFGGQK